jgi:hypothetical protein
MSGTVQSSALTAVIIVLLLLVNASFAYGLQSPPVAGAVPQQAVTAAEGAVTPPVWRPDDDYWRRVATNFNHRTKWLVEYTLKDMELYFSEKRNGVVPFCADVNGYRSTARFIMSNLPFMDPDQWTKRTQHSMKKHIFSAEGLDQQLKKTIQDFVENMLTEYSAAVEEVNADVLELGPAIRPQLPVAEKVQQVMDLTVRSSSEVLQHHLPLALTSDIASQILSAVAVRIIQTSSGKAVGATVTSASLGLSLVAGILFDKLAGIILDWYSDPQGTLEAKLEAHLVQLELDVISNKDKPAVGSLRHTLQILRTQMYDNLLTQNEQ